MEASSALSWHLWPTFEGDDHARRQHFLHTYPTNPNRKFDLYKNHLCYIGLYNSLYETGCTVH